ncbi:MAG: SulP family inorganic anion transporter [Candidatus Moranbacteria bacterium]|nr:SulP family inorganic anion transporter [Candidatus Moranbacteria bacterium]MDD3965198.1 SulP family inorganic anion transporter [Candidatus Moranbacteria bacterium]
MNRKKMSIRERIEQNWKSGLTVSFVSVPLSISLAVAAGATPLMGVITAIWAGLVASFFGGSRFNIVGPTGALSGLLIVYGMTYGITILPFMAILSGVFILLVFLFHWERYIIFVPSNVVHGFTLGVAFIIGLGQLNFALGLENLVSHEKLIENIHETLLHIDAFQMSALILFSVGLTFLFVWKKFYPTIPGVIVLAPVGIFLGYLSQKSMLFNIHFQTLFTKFGDISGSLWSIPKISFVINEDVIVGALAISLVAILETLLSAKVADGMTKTKHNVRKEVLGVGLANVASGVFGGIPATAALARTALNIKSGANDQMSATINSIFVLLISILFLSVFTFLPLPVIGSVLVFVAIQMVEKKHYIHIYNNDKSALFVSMLVALVTIVMDPMAGLLIGSAVALLIFVDKTSKSEAEITINKDKKIIKRVNAAKIIKIKDHGDVIVYRFAGQLTYVNIQSHINTVEAMNGGAQFAVLSLRNLFFMDMDGVTGLKEIIDIFEAKGKKVYITAVGSLINDSLKKEKWFVILHDNERVFESTQDALITINASIKE